MTKNQTILSSASTNTNKPNKKTVSSIEHVKKKYVCVAWENEENASVEPASSVRLKNDEEIEEGAFYNVKFGNSEFRGEILCYGEFSFCVS